MPSALHLKILGRVQGVGFRYFVQASAVELQLTGWVRNTPDGSVEAYAEGPKERLDALLKHVLKGPPLSRVDKVLPNWQTPQNQETSFTIR